MRKFVLLLALCAVTAAIGIAASDPAPPNPPKSDGTAKSDGQSCDYKSAEDIVKEWRNAPQQSVSGPPPCPADPQNCSSTNTCAGNNTCGIAGGFTSTDTGLDKCKESDGTVVNCQPQHQTVHVRTAPCALCPCCNDPIPCACPNTCTQIIQLVCS